MRTSSGDLETHGVHPGDPYELLTALTEKLDFKRPPARVLANIIRSIGIEHLKPIAPPPQEALPRWRRFAEGLRHSKTRDAEAIHHHYDVSNTFYEWVLGPSMTYTCAVLPASPMPRWRRRRTTSTGWCSRSCGSSRVTVCSTSAAAGAAWCATPPGAACRRIGVTLSAEQAAWAQQAIDEEGLADLAEVRHSDYRDIAEAEFDAVSSIGLHRAHRRAQLPGVLRVPADRSCAPAGCCSTTASPAPTTAAAHRAGGFIDRYVFPDGELTGSGRIITEIAGRRPGGGARGEPAPALRADTAGLVPQPGRALG